jgi:hypothetical protein
MYKNLIPKFGATVAGLGLALSMAQSQTVTILESFEDGVDSVVSSGNRADDAFQIAEYTREGADDAKVTDGDKALKLTLIGDYGWGNDAELTFSDEASALLKQAWASKAEGRYLLRYDVEFPTEGVNWGNFMAHINGWDYAQLEAGGAANRSMSQPLDLVTADLAAEGPVTLTIIDQYGIEGGTESIDVFIDNFRLVDTYVSGAVPEVTVLNGFESQADVDLIVPVSERYTVALHEKTGADDLAVTEGNSSLEITFTAGGGWTRDFTIPFKGTIMESIARIPKEDRGRYTFRMDVIFSALEDGDWPGNWQNFIPREAGGGALNFAMHRLGGDQHVRTYSLPLDQALLTPNDPDNPDDVNPGLSFVNQGAWGDGGMTLHYDNLRIIDTGKAPLEIGNLTLNSDSGGVDISWASSPAQAYGISVSNDLTGWTELATDILGSQTGDTTTYTAAVEDLAGQEFYRVFVSGAAPPLNEGFEDGALGWTVSTGAGHEGEVTWEVGEPTNGPGAARTGSSAAGTDLDADYTSGTWVIYSSPEVSLGPILKPRLTFSYFLDVGEGSAGRVNIVGSDGSEFYAPSTPDEELFFVEGTEGWQEATFDLTSVAGGQKVILQFEFIGNGTGAGFFIDDVLIEDASE